MIIALPRQRIVIVANAEKAAEAQHASVRRKNRIGVAGNLRGIGEQRLARVVLEIAADRAAYEVIPGSV